MTDAPGTSNHPDDEIFAFDLDDTGSMHICWEGDPESVSYTRTDLYEAALAQRDQAIKLTEKAQDQLLRLDQKHDAALARVAELEVWRRIGEGDIPKDTIILLGWVGFGGKWETTTDYYHNTRGGWVHGSAEYWAPLPALPSKETEND